MDKEKQLPKIYVFCNSCSPQCHRFMAIAEDGTFLGGHICSGHEYADHDMGVVENGWKRDLYAAHYPGGFTVERLDIRSRQDADNHPGLSNAFKLNQAMTAADPALAAEQRAKALGIKAAP